MNGSRVTGSVRIAAIQARPVSEEFDALWAGGDVPHAVDLLEAAARAGARCAVFPELYPRVGEAELRRAARRLGLVVVAGLADGTRERWANTATVIGPDGSILGRQGKCYPTQGELDQGVVAESVYRAIDTPVGRLGIVICADFAFFAESADAVMAQDVDILVNPAWWFALGAAYPGTVIGRHMQYGKPLIGVDIAACALTFRDAGGPCRHALPESGRLQHRLRPPARDEPGRARRLVPHEARRDQHARRLRPDPGRGRRHAGRRRRP